MNFDVIPNKLNEPLGVSTPIGDSILVESLSYNCPICTNMRVL